MTAPATRLPPAPARVGAAKGLLAAALTPEGLILAGPTLAIGVLAVKVGPWTMHGLGVAAVVVAVAAALSSVGWVSTQRVHRMAVHTHGGHGTRLAARHEAGHYHVGHKVGGRVSGAKIYPDGSGITWVDVPCSAGPAAAVAVAVAGQVAAGTKKGCDGFKGSDFDFKRQILRSLPADQRATVERAGYQIARRHCNGLFSPVPSIAARLYRDGKIR
ncbi:MAG: hypothetical protein L0K86_21975 [Actinomycetia bacterium]|nr:hypothetical protein [Actinomycetes bacterium]